MYNCFLFGYNNIHSFTPKLITEKPHLFIGNEEKLQADDLYDPAIDSDELNKFACAPSRESSEKDDIACDSPTATSSTKRVIKKKVTIMKRVIKKNAADTKCEKNMITVCRTKPVTKYKITRKIIIKKKKGQPKPGEAINLPPEEWNTYNAVAIVENSEMRMIELAIELSIPKTKRSLTVNTYLLVKYY